MLRLGSGTNPRFLLKTLHVREIKFWLSLSWLIVLHLTIFNNGSCLSSSKCFCRNCSIFRLCFLLNFLGFLERVCCSLCSNGNGLDGCVWCPCCCCSTGYGENGFGQYDRRFGLGSWCNCVFCCFGFEVGGEPSCWSRWWSWSWWWCCCRHFGWWCLVVIFSDLLGWRCCQLLVQIDSLLVGCMVECLLLLVTVVVTKLFLSPSWNGMRRPSSFFAPMLILPAISSSSLILGCVVDDIVSYFYEILGWQCWCWYHSLWSNQ